MQVLWVEYKVSGSQCEVDRYNESHKEDVKWRSLISESAVNPYVAWYQNSLHPKVDPEPYIEQNGYEFVMVRPEYTLKAVKVS